MKYCQSLLTILALLGASVICTPLVYGEELTREQKAYAERVFKDRKRQVGGELEFHGQVVDFAGSPISEAKIVATIIFVPESPLDPREVKVVEKLTDKRGHFSIKEEGFSLSIKEISREGYAYRFEYNRDRVFAYSEGSESEGRGGSVDKPAIFRIRKLAPPAFVVSHNMTFGKSPGKPSLFDLIKRRWVHKEESIIAMSYSSLDKDWHTDILLAVEGEPGKLRLVMEAPDEESGFVVEKHEFFEMMTEAPQHGYRRRVEVPVKEGASPLTAYVKAQGGLFYSRIKVEFAERQSGRVAVNATSFTNLTGDRALEYIAGVESQYDWEVNIDHVRKEIRRADLLSGQPIAMPQRVK